ncbi:MAG: hypothetical protein OXI27_08295 [Thaumarchaeota archaeon]|nr:hypothetical protein [Nitrososphaerota archaeon]
MAAMLTPDQQVGVERRGGAVRGAAAGHAGHDMDDLYWLNPAVASAAITAAGILTRLELATDALDSAIASIRGQIRDIRGRNRRLAPRYDPGNEVHAKSMGLEHVMSVMLEALIRARQRMVTPATARQVPRTLLPALYVVRTAHMQLSQDAAPGCQESLHDASAHLGGIILDAATISGSNLNLGRSNAEVSAIFSQARLTVDSKLRKQYDKLEMPAACRRYC